MKKRATIRIFYITDIIFHQFLKIIYVRNNFTDEIMDEKMSLENISSILYILSVNPSII